MKIYKSQPKKLIRLVIRKQGLSPVYMTLDETTIEEVQQLIERIVVDQKISPLLRSKRTGVDIRDALGSKNGAQKSVSFIGIDPKQMEKLIIKYVEHQTVKS